MTDTATSQADELVRAGQLQEAISALQEQVRRDPANAKNRVFLFQLMAILGQWDRAMTQLNVAAEMDASNLLMAQMCRVALNCEALRAAIFSGDRLPMVFGEPAEWVGWLVQANQMVAKGQSAAAQELRDKAYDAAPAVSGKINDTPFQWIADADSRLGPMLEAVVNGKYYWVPLNSIHELLIEPPSDLRDLVWIPASFTWTNGGQVVGLIPTRYPGSESSDDSQVKMARKTIWTECDGGWFVGSGQRMLTTDDADYPLLETRSITFDNEVVEVVEGAQEEGNG